jgi:branched-chain amino acid transport system permease protein
MDLAAVVVIQIVYAIAGLALMSIGLAIIFGMMRVINFAHGEFMMLGAYAMAISTQAGINFWISMLIIAPLFAGLIGIVVERLIVRHLYGRMIDTLLATWGLSLLLVGLFTTIFGNATEGISDPIGGMTIGRYNESGYKLFLIFITAVIVVGVYLVLKMTRLGLIARSTMQNSDMASCLGVNPRMVYTLTFGIGSALTGLAGAVFLPVSALYPTIGAAFIAKAFITVIVGGVSIVAGTASASVLLGAVNQGTTFAVESIIGDVALFAAAVVLVRALPQGITGRFFRWSI